MVSKNKVQFELTDPDNNKTTFGTKTATAFFKTRKGKKIKIAIKDAKSTSESFTLVGEYTVGGIPTPPPDCSLKPNSHLDPATNKCVCDTGFHEVEGVCIPDTPPPDCSLKPHSHLDPVTQTCVCDDGFHEVDGICVPDPDCSAKPNSHWDGTACVCDAGFHDEAGVCVEDGPDAGKDRFGIPFLHKSKTGTGAFFYEMSDNPKNDKPMDVLDEHYTVTTEAGAVVIKMTPDGATSLGIGKNVRTGPEPQGKCKMSYKLSEQQMWTSSPDDVRDLEFKAVIRIKGIGAHGFSMSACTNRHTEPKPCTQGFAYMFNIEDPSAKPTTFRHRKEMWHVSYHNSPLGIWSVPEVPMALDGAGWFGYGYCRYNSPDNKKVILEPWICPPGKDFTKKENWFKLKTEEDFNGHGWGNDGNSKFSDGTKMDGAPDQYGPWSGRQNRLKTNATSGTIEFKCITFRAIDG